MINTVGEVDPDGSAMESADTDEIDFSAASQALPMLEQLPRQTLDAAREKAELVPASTREQTGAAFVKAFYRELGVDTDDIQSSYIVHAGLLMLLIALISAVASILVGFFASKVAAGMSRNLRRSLFEKWRAFRSTSSTSFPQRPL
jgi:ATP-binding cassette subfamily B protein